jgi:RNA polymerase sigma-70 factor (ECF subfamily)
MAAATSLGSVSGLSNPPIPVKPAFPIWVNARRKRDELFVEKVRGGERELFYELLRPHLRTLHGMIYKILGDAAKTEDAVQQSVLQALVHFHQLRSPEFFRAWLIRIAINEARIALRKDRNVCFTPIQGEEESDGGETVRPRVLRDEKAIPSEVLEQKEIKEIIGIAIRSLPAKLRQVLILRDIEEYTIVETASRLGISISATKARLHRARLRLKASRSLVQLRRSAAAQNGFPVLPGER